MSPPPQVLTTTPPSSTTAATSTTHQPSGVDLALPRDEASAAALLALLRTCASFAVPGAVDDEHVDRVIAALYKDRVVVRVRGESRSA